MLTTRMTVGIIAFALNATAGFAYAQTYPDKPLRIVTQDPGGGTDIAARLIAPGLGARLGQSVIVDNRSTLNSAEIAAKAQPDGYTLLLIGGNLWITPLLQKTSYDPVRDFAPVIIIDSSPQIVVVHPSLPIKSVKELIAYAKGKPGALNYSSGGTGGGAHLATELFKHMADVNIVRVAYKGGGPAVAALVAGEVQLSFASASGAMPQVKAGRLRALAVTSAQPSALVPGVPAVAETVPGYEFVSPDVIVAPAHTPAAIVRRLNEEIVRVINNPEVKNKFFESGVETVGSSPEQFAAFIKADMARIGKLIKDADIKGN